MEEKKERNENIIEASHARAGVNAAEEKASATTLGAVRETSSATAIYMRSIGLWSSEEQIPRGRAQLRGLMGRTEERRNTIAPNTKINVSFVEAAFLAITWLEGSDDR